MLLNKGNLKLKESSKAIVENLLHLNLSRNGSGKYGDAPPLRSELFSAEQMKQHGRRLAGLHKLSPLLDWSEAEVWRYISAHRLPYNPLHDRHYPSIGCSPCTRAIQPGESRRAGRWWWEQPESRECGLHPRHPAAAPAASLN